MKPQTLRTFLDVHTWTGLGAGMALFIAFYAGAVTVFTDEIHEWDTYQTETPAAQTLGDAQSLMNLALIEEPGAASFFRLELATAHVPTYTGRWFERMDNGDFETHEFRLTPEGELTTTQEQGQLADFIYRLHYSAGLPTRLGLYTLGVICVLYGLALVSGIVLFAPNFIKDLLIVRPGKNRKRFWLDAHNVVGVVSLPWHVMFAWSSAVLAIGIFFIAPFQLLVFEEDLVSKFGPELGALPPMEAAGSTAPSLDIATLLSNAQTALPEFQATQMRFEHFGDANGRVTVIGHSAADTLVPFASVVLSTTSGQVLHISDPRTATPGGTLYRGLTTLHFADFGGDVVRWTWFLLSMAGAFLFFSGNLLYIESRRKRRSLAQPAKTRFMARLNNGVCIGCMAGVSAAFLVSRGLMTADNRATLMELAYYLTFAGSIGWAFLRHAATGARELLLLSACLTIAIPLLDALILGMPIWASWAAGAWSLVMIDLVAIALAACFWQMASAVHRRARSGDSNSVWSYAQRGDTSDTGPVPDTPASPA